MYKETITKSQRKGERKMKKIVKELAKEIMIGQKGWELANHVDFKSFVNVLYVTSDITERDKNFLLKLYDWIAAGMPELESVHNAFAQGYIRKCENGYKSIYVGKYGAGYIQHWRGNGTSRYHVIEYHIIEY